ncbi:hypothetical protein AMATHDRAFT_62868 [Amanita thiersii Skay4041]|uniref:Het-C-domain-containing protein n=1 Tax=Amanita thiersii Skay4041 TaxID=703135 RepID=A0A2A9NML4_9AGAR|nr:hypothetical protein AMATHDRAFT_62868 [Amanita thiersii Skay4041]
MIRFSSLLPLLFFISAFCLSQNGVHAFGAGNIPSFAYMEGRAFRHGDIEDTLADLVKRSGGLALASLISKGPKFNGLDIKRVYFGNWLRDYSQAVDIAGLKKVQLQSIITICMVLGFLAHGYATNEFEVTPERLGVYLPVEHIDNPKGYGDGEDARKYHPKLRGPVDPRELDIDPRTGMKNYIANEQGSWDTSKAHVRRVLQECIRLGRLHRQQGRKQDEYEAYRLLGTALHTLEDFAAHSNFCELVLVSMGFQEVFTHVGEQVRIQAPGGKWVAPLVTGTFGSSDFIHSILGEATDHLSEASVTDLNREFEKARDHTQGTRGKPGSNPVETLRSLVSSIPGEDGNEMSREMGNIERLRAGPAQGSKRPEEMTPREIHDALWDVLIFRDSVVKKISKTIEKIPGLGPLLEKISESISVFVYTTIEPILKPILKNATAGLTAASGEVIDTHDQYEVFNDPRASDPTHSFLSKDHFNLILNEPAGLIAKVVVTHAVNLVTKAWDDSSQNVNQIIEDILWCFFHPDFHNPSSTIQREMLQAMKDWATGLGKRQRSVIQRLTKESVRNHQNTRLAGEGGAPASTNSFAVAEAHAVQQDVLGYAQNIPIIGEAASSLLKPSKPNKPSKPSKPGKPGKGHKKGDSGGEESGFYSSMTTTTTETFAESYSGGSGVSGGYAPLYETAALPSIPTYQPPAGPPPALYGTPAEPNPHVGYAPSYTPSYTPPAGPPPGFPGGSAGSNTFSDHSQRRHEYGYRDIGSGAHGYEGSFSSSEPHGFPEPVPTTGGGYAPPPGPPPSSFGFPRPAAASSYQRTPSSQGGPAYPGSGDGNSYEYDSQWRG